MPYCHGHDLAEETTVFQIWPGTGVTYVECAIPNWENLNRTSIKPKTCERSNLMAVWTEVRQKNPSVSSLENPNTASNLEAGGLTVDKSGVVAADDNLGLSSEPPGIIGGIVHNTEGV
jgi:hypothetical protein